MCPDASEQPDWDNGDEPVSDATTAGSEVADDAAASTSDKTNDDTTKEKPKKRPRREVTASIITYYDWGGRIGFCKKVFTGYQINKGGTTNLWTAEPW